MEEYIKKETAYRAIMGERPEAREPSWFAEIVLEIPAVDAVEVVRCKDCMYRDKDFLWCDRRNVRMAENDFCSYGERRTDGK